MDGWSSRSRTDEFRFRLVDPFTLQEVGDVDCYPRGSALTWGYYTDNILQGSLSVSGSVERDGVTCMVRVYDRVTIGGESEEFCLGTLFADEAPTVYRFGRQSANLSCYGSLWRFTQDVLISDFSRETGYKVVQAIRDVVEADGGHLVVGDGVDTARGFGNPIFFEIGEKRSTVINTMAGWIGCQIAIDEWGDITIDPYVEPGRRPVVHEFVEGDGCELTAGGPPPPGPVRKKAGCPPQTAATGSQARPWAETSFQSCQGRPSRAAGIWTLDSPGKTSASLSCPRSSSSSSAAPE